MTITAPTEFDVHPARWHMVKSDQALTITEPIYGASYYDTAAWTEIDGSPTIANRLAEFKPFAAKVLISAATYPARIALAPNSRE